MIVLQTEICQSLQISVLILSEWYEIELYIYMCLQVLVNETEASFTFKHRFTEKSDIKYLFVNGDIILQSVTMS